MSGEIGFEVRLELPYENTLEGVRTALKSEKFGVLTLIDVWVTLKENLVEVATEARTRLERVAQAVLA